MTRIGRLMVFAAAAAAAPSPCLSVPAETVGRAVLPEPQPSWLMLLGSDAGYIFDGADGQMQGMISHSPFTTAIVTLPSRREAYFVDSFYSRGVRGERSDMLTVVDMTELTPKAEVPIPSKAAALRIRGHIGLLNDERHVVVFNMTPAQSVSVVDVVDREFAGELSTAGCAIVMPAGPRGFLMLCGDGTLQFIQLDADGKEAGRQRSKPFFEVEKDPVYDRVVYAGGDWLLVTHDGVVRQVGVDGDRIRVGEAWSMLNAEDREEGGTKEQWRPGGEQPFAMHRGGSLLYSLMHKGKVDTQDANGTEVWVFDTNRRKRVGRMVLAVEARSILVSQEATPRLYLIDKDNKLHIHDGRTFRLQRTVEKPGPGGPLLQTLAPHD
jgi:methylamine dehydrogenase heavy chain